MRSNLAEIASLVGGQLNGDASLICVGANPPAQAIGGQITLLDDPKRFELVEQSAAIAVIVAEPIESLDCPQIIVADPHQAFAKIVAKFRPPIDFEQDLAEPQIDSTAFVHPTAHIGGGTTIGARTRIGPGAVIMPRCQIGNDCVVHANTTLYEYTSVADRVVIHAGAVIGACGFGYRQENGKHIPAAQLGYVDVHCDVEIGAGVTIDRGSYGATTIGEGTKIDNQVQIAHNCQIGKHNLLCSQVGIAGSCTTGDHVIMAGQVGLKDHIHVEDRVVVGAQAGVMEDLKEGNVYLGSPCATQRETMQVWAVTRKLPEMRREVKLLRRQLEQMESELSGTDRRAA